MTAVSSKEAQAYLIDPMNAPDPAAETGLNAHFANTMAAVPNGTASTTSASSPRTSLGANNPFRDDLSSVKQNQRSHTSKSGEQTSPSNRRTSREAFPNYRAEAFGDYPIPQRSSSQRHHRPPPSYDDAVSGNSSPPSRRRGSSLRERYPGDRSHQPLDIIRRDSKRADRSPHLNKKHMPGADMIDRLDPAVGGRPYHHEGPYDAATLARNQGLENSPIAALKTSNEEALKATPAENIKDAVERHKPLDGVAQVPPGVPDRFGRTYDYEEGTDLMRVGTSDAGYKRWPGRDYDPEDLKGQAEPTFSLDRALRAHKINENGIEMEDRAEIAQDYHKAQRAGTLDNRDPVRIAGDDGRYVDLEIANTKDNDIGRGVRRGSSLKGVSDGLKKRIGSLRRKNKDDA